MILYFSATGNSLAVARQLAERLNEQLMPLIEAVRQDLTNEKRIGLVFPTYDFNLPPAMPEMISRLKISPQSYVFTVVTCGSAAGNCIWVLRRILREKGIELAYSHKGACPITVRWLSDAIPTNSWVSSNVCRLAWSKSSANWRKRATCCTIVGSVSSHGFSAVRLWSEV
jgi:hypothetical protein